MFLTIDIFRESIDNCSCLIWYIRFVIFAASRSIYFLSVLFYCIKNCRHFSNICDPITFWVAFKYVIKAWSTRRHLCHSRIVAIWGHGILFVLDTIPRLNTLRSRRNIPHSVDIYKFVSLSLRIKCHGNSRDLVDHLKWRHQVFVLSTVRADGQA